MNKPALIDRIFNKQEKTAWNWAMAFTFTFLIAPMLFLGFWIIYSIFYIFA